MRCQMMPSAIRRSRELRPIGNEGVRTIQPVHTQVDTQVFGYVELPTPLTNE